MSKVSPRLVSPSAAFSTDRRVSHVNTWHNRSRFSLVTSRWAHLPPEALEALELLELPERPAEPPALLAVEDLLVVEDTLQPQHGEPLRASPS